jgi:hypothetical protein
MAQEKNIYKERHPPLGLVPIIMFYNIADTLPSVFCLSIDFYLPLNGGGSANAPSDKIRN